MNKFSMKKLLSILLCIALIASLALSTVGCSKNDKTEPVASAETSGGTVSMGEGEDSEYGLYVKTVNGVTVDYDQDGKYWAFYVDGEYAATGVDSTDITAGATYTFKAE